MNEPSSETDIVKMRGVVAQLAEMESDKEKLRYVINYFSRPRDDHGARPVEPAVPIAASEPEKKRRKRRLSGLTIKPAVDKLGIATVDEIWQTAREMGVKFSPNQAIGHKQVLEMLRKSQQTYYRHADGRWSRINYKAPLAPISG